MRSANHVACIRERERERENENCKKYCSRKKSARNEVHLIDLDLEGMCDNKLDLAHNRSQKNICNLSERFMPLLDTDK